MNFKPKTEKELAMAQLLPDGTYPYEVIEASEGVSKKGNSMVKLKLNVFGRDFSTHIYDYVSGSFMEHRLRHFCYSCGLENVYGAGAIEPRQCVGRQGYAHVVLEEKNDGFPAKNVIYDYVIEEASLGPVTVPETSTIPPVILDGPKPGDDEGPNF